VIRGVLNGGHLKFAVNDFSVFCQPGFEDWSSINDFLMFAREIAQSRHPVPARQFVDFFNEALPRIMAVTDFDNPDIPFDQILLNIIDRCLGRARTHALSLLELCIQLPILRLQPADLKRCPNVPCITDGARAVLTAFRNKANELHPTILEYSPPRTDSYLQMLQADINEAASSACMTACVAVLPMIQTDCFNQLKERIQNTIGAADRSTVGLYNFSELCSDRQKQGVEMLEVEATRLNAGLTSRREFLDAAEKLRLDIAVFMKELEVRKKGEYEQYRREAAAKFEQGLEDKYNKMLDTWTKKQIEAQKELDRQRNQQLRETADELAREKLKNEHQSALWEERTRSEEALARAKKEADDRVRALEVQINTLRQELTPRKSSCSI
jgi:hypothetical protein